MQKEIYKNNSEQERKAEYSGGVVEYSVIEKPSVDNPILVVPGFTEGRVVLRDFAQILSDEGERTVIFPDQPRFDKSKEKMSVVDHHAEALLSMVEAESLEDKTVDVITHSFGSLVLARQLN